MLVGLTGGSGFLGGYIARRLVRDGHKLRALVRETSDVSLLEELGAELVEGGLADERSLGRVVEGVGCVVHAAVDFGLPRGGGQVANFELNLVGSLKLLDFCRRSGAQYIFISSGAVHEKILDDRLLDENHPVWPGSTYGAYKAAVEAFLPAYKSQFGVNGSALRPTAICGVHMTRPVRSHWHSLVKSVIDGETVETARGGKVVHAADVAEAVARAVGNERVAGESYELTDCHVYDETVARFAKEASGSDADIRQAAPGTGPKHRIVCDKAARELGVALDRGHDGIRKYVEELVGVIREGAERFRPQEGGDA